jgi:hypothetical protein
LTVHGRVAASHPGGRDAVRLGLRFAAARRALTVDPAAAERWVDVYAEPSDGQPGLAGAATARAEAHTIRLALIYALLDCSERICLEHLEHLEAGLAVWRYSATSAAWVSATASAIRPPMVAIAGAC